MFIKHYYPSGKKNYRKTEKSHRRGQHNVPNVPARADIDRMPSDNYFIKLLHVHYIHNGTEG